MQLIASLIAKHPTLMGARMLAGLHINIHFCEDLEGVTYAIPLTKLTPY